VGLSLQFSSLIKLTKSVDLVHSLASRELLNILFHQQHLLVHLNAMKKYLLLGQGDFVRHLMDLIQ
jgi:gamma-tubulin complex component 3